MRPAVRAQLELTEEMLAQLDRMFGTLKQPRGDAVVLRCRVHGLEAIAVREKP